MSSFRFQQCVALVLCVAALATGCSRNTPPARPLLSDATSVLLITVDTTRADHIGCYGYRKAETSSIDALAESGVRFESAFCQVPLTLPSHTSLLTGTYPVTNGVRVNGARFECELCPTLAEAFHDRGRQTAAFVSGRTLQSQFGLDRGFDVYNDDLGGSKKGERLANTNTDAALRWLTTKTAGPFFLWVHYYDPHARYSPPEPFRSRLADPYDGEIAFVDTQIGRLLRWLKAANLRKTTLVIVAGDHGESLGEHGERTHGLLVYNATMHVPLIFSLPSVLPTQRAVNEPVGLIDIAPTLSDLFGWKPQTAFEGTSFASVFRNGKVAPRPVFGESAYPSRGFGWAELRSLTTDNWKYIDAPRPELYRLANDPTEVKNVIADHPVIAAQVHEHLVALTDRMVPRASESASLDTDTLTALEALGYVGGSTARTESGSRNARQDPKDMVGAFAAHADAMGLLKRGQFDRVVEIMEPLVRQSPESDEFYVTLGRAYLNLGRYEDAQKAFEESLRIVPDHPRRLWRLGDALRHQGKLDEAAQNLRAAIVLAPDLAIAHAALAEVLERQGKNAAAKQQQAAAAAAAASPDLARAHLKQGLKCARQRRFAQAEKHLRRVIEIEPASSEALANLGSVLHRMGRDSEAIGLLQGALKLDPKQKTAHETLFQVYAVNQQTKAALEALRAACIALPQKPQLRKQLAWMLATTSHDRLRSPEEALRIAGDAINVDRATPDDLVILAAAYAANGKFGQAVSTATRALSLAGERRETQTVPQIQEQLDLYRSGLPYRE